MTAGPISDQYASRFASTLHDFPPGVEVDLFIICNGGPLRTELAMIFPAYAKMFPRPNVNKDLGGYMDSANGPCKDYDMMVCLGESVYFHRAGWLERLADEWVKTGPGIYGPFSSNLVRPHLQTTAFCTSPTLLRKCPLSVNDRYAWEHGEHSFWRWIYSQGMPVRLVTWDGAFEPRMWRVPQNILWRGDQSNCLMWSNHTERWRDATQKIKNIWSRGANQAFK